MSILLFLLGFIGLFVLAALAIFCFVLFLSDKSKKYLLVLAIISTVIVVAAVVGSMLFIILSITPFSTNDETTFRNDLYALNGTYTDYCDENETCLDIMYLLSDMDTEYTVSINQFDEVDSIYDNSTVYNAEVFFYFGDESYEDITVIGNVVFNSDGISYDSDFYQNLFEQISAFQTS